MIISQIFCSTSNYDQGGLITTKFAHNFANLRCVGWQEGEEEGVKCNFVTNIETDSGIVRLDSTDYRGSLKTINIKRPQWHTSV